MVHRDPGSGCRQEPRLRRGPRSCLGWETTPMCRAGHPSGSQPSMAPGANSRTALGVAGLPGSALVQERSAPAGGAEARSSPRRPRPNPRARPPARPPARHPGGPPAARAPGPPLMPAMAVTSLLAPRPGRWPGDPRRATAARQHPEVHDAALPPAASRSRGGVGGARGRRFGDRLRRAGRAGRWFPSGPADSARPESPRSGEDAGRCHFTFCTVLARRARFSPPPASL